ncbi:SMEK domain-containing protein [Chitinophaga sp. SYP-B3965]|uniref:SMEK domain-containing protein n=1 Tax=Chitinophaga sp. SYP-B3965 TaxID=2663120 RepID=UPI001299A60B|nr:SMEK domain-containing protein [Chitinophaga sp. SYP-B3965]MRG49026.1 SMEK domain-containing protein [Chitinophaga sp. SYP-B3965]
MNQAQKLFRISQLLSRFREQVKILNANGEFSINLHAENILIKVLNEVYGWNLENVNYTEGKNYPAIDLRDKAAGVAVQVTSTTRREKQDAAIHKFTDEGFNNLYLFIITDKPPKAKRSAWKILDRTDLYRALNAKNNPDTIDRVMQILEGQFADTAAMDKWQLYCKGLESYDQYIHNRYQFLDIKGFSPKINNTLVKITLEDIYVPLELKMENNAFVTHVTEKVFGIEEALAELNRLVILGDPGSGKSTILKYLAYDICTNRTKKLQYAELLPVLIKGSEYAKYLAASYKSLAEFIIDQLDRKYEHLFAEKLEKSQLIVLIDGIDEINRIKLRHDVVERINAFIAQYPEIKIIVSSRIVGYKEVQLNAHFHHLQVGRFGHEQIQQFVSNWFAAIMGDKGDHNNTDDLLRAISRNKSVYELAGSPLLLTIIALIHYQGNTLPEKRVALYEVATSTFLENWVRQREPSKPANFDKEMLIEMLSPISFHIHQNYTTGLISESELKGLLLEEYRKINPKLSTKEEKSDVRDIIEFLREDAGFLFEKGRNEQGEAMFGFVHQTFQEYFAAIEFVARWKEGAFKENLDIYVYDANWREVITLAASIFRLNDNTRISRQTASRFIKDILNVKDIFPALSRPLLVVMQVLANDVEVEFSLVEEIMDTAFDIMIKDADDPPNGSFGGVFWGLLNMEQFQYYLFEKYITVIKKKGTPGGVIEAGFFLLLSHSYIPAVKNELLKILRSKNEELKWHLFNHSETWSAEIFTTSAFREEMLKYLNSKTFIENYEGKLPFQYRIGITRRELSKHGSKKDQEELLIENRILFVRQLECKQMRMDLIFDHVKTTEVIEPAFTKRYLSRVKETFPEIDIAHIERVYEAEVLLQSSGLHRRMLMRFGSVSVHAIEGDETKFGFVDDKKALKILDYPFDHEGLVPYFGEEAAAVQRVLSIAIRALSKWSLKVSVSSMEDFLLFIKYYDNMHRDTVMLNAVHVINYALNYVVDDRNPARPVILSWLKRQDFNTQWSYFVNRRFMEKKYKDMLNESTLAPNDKLFILHLIGKKRDYEHLIIPTIDEFNETSNAGEKRSIKALLAKVLE